MRLNCALLTTILLLLGVLGSKGAILQRPQRDVQTTEISDERKDQVPVAVIEVQEPDTVVQSLQVDTAIQTTYDSAATENEQENEAKDSLPTEQTEIENLEQSTAADKLETELEMTTELKSELENELKKIEPVKSTEFNEIQQKAITSESTVFEQTPNNSQDQILEPSEIVAEKEVLSADTAALKDPVTEGNVDPEGRQNTPNEPSAESTTQQNFVQFIQNTPIGQFFTQLTGGQQQQQQQQQQGVSETPAADTPQTSQIPQVPGFLNPGVALTQAQQAVQNAAQSVVNSTTQAFQGLQQFASSIGNQFQSTISSLSGQNQQNLQQDATTARPQGPIQAIVSNFVNPNQATTNSPGQPQGPFQGIISFFQGGQRPQTNNANQLQNQAANNAATVSNDKPSVDDKIESQEPEITNEVRNSEESLDSFEESQSGQDLIVVNDDATLVTEQTSSSASSSSSSSSSSSV